MKQLFSVLILSLILSPLSFAKEVAGVKIPDTMKAGESTLNLNGAGIRTKFFMDIYVGGLYLNEASNSGAEISKADAPMAIKLHIVSGMLTNEKMQNATNEGFVNATNGNTAPIKSEITDFIDVFAEEIKENDVFDLVYVPGTGVEVYKNSQLKSTIQGGMPFKEALFGIWLSDKPAQEKLKEAMLGG